MAHPELDALFNTLLPFAKTMLREYGEFYPFGAIMCSNGEIRQVGAKIEDNDHPPSEDLIDLLSESFEKQAANGELRAAGICYDALTVPPGEDRKRDAICCGLEHYSGENVDVFVPYIRAADGNVKYDEAFAAKRGARFFLELPRC
jgi:hypothetical protein